MDELITQSPEHENNSPSAPPINTSPSSGVNTPSVGDEPVIEEALPPEEGGPVAPIMENNDEPTGKVVLSPAEEATAAEVAPAVVESDIKPAPTFTESLELPVLPFEGASSPSSDEMVEHVIAEHIRHEEELEAQATSTDEVDANAEEAPSPQGALVIQSSAEFSNQNERIEEGKDRLEVLSEDVSGLKDELKRAKSDISALKEQIELLSSGVESLQSNGTTNSSTQTESSHSQSPDMAVLFEDPSAQSQSPAKPPTPAREMEAWVSQAMGHKPREFDTDVADFNRYSQDAAMWANSSRAFVDALNAALPVFEAALARAETSKDALLGHLKDKAESALKGLRLTHTMLGRAADRARDLGNGPAGETASLEPISRANWEECLAGVTDRDEAAKRIRARFAEAENARYKSVSQARADAEGARKKLLGFIEKQMLPICDGVEDGRRHAQTELDRVREAEFENDAPRQNFEAWFGVFEELGAALRAVLSPVGVQPLEVLCGQPIDYNTQEPFETVADASMQTEDVAEVVRHGYVFRGSDGAQIVLRPAQVVVVKN